MPAKMLKGPSTFDKVVKGTKDFFGVGKETKKRSRHSPRETTYGTLVRTETIPKYRAEVMKKNGTKKGKKVKPTVKGNKK